jgi:hypothetical protein
MINRHGHRTLAGSIVVVTLILLSQRNSLEAFQRYIPLFVALGLLATVHLMPWFETYFQERNRITLGEYVLANRGVHPGGSYRAVADLTSVQSNGEPQGRLSRGWTQGQDPIVFAHMHLNGQYERTTRPESPEHSSTLDLEAGSHQQAPSNTASAESQDPFLSEDGMHPFRA